MGWVYEEHADTHLLVCGGERKPHLEWSTGMEHFVRMLPMMMASLRVHVPDSHNGIRIPAWHERHEISQQNSGTESHYQRKTEERG